MNKSSFIYQCAFAAMGFLGFAATQAQGTAKATNTDYTKYVDPFVGNADNGHTFPGACSPFGMIQASPVTGGVGWRYCAEYVYSDSIIWGFTQNHLNGTGCMDLGDILVMPSTGQRTRSWDGYRSRFNKKQEFASPGYYSVYLTDAKVKAELTTILEREAISLAGEPLRNPLGRCTNAGGPCAEHGVGEARLLLRTEV